MNNESQNSIISENTEMIGSVNVKVELQNSDIQTVTPKLQKKVYRQLIQTAVLKVLGNPVDRTNLPMDVELSKLYHGLLNIWTELLSMFLADLPT